VRRHDGVDRAGQDPVTLEVAQGHREHALADAVDGSLELGEALVFLDAMVPEDGGTAADVLPVTKQLIDGAVDTAMLPDQPVRCLLEPVRLDNPAAKAVPRTHVRCVGGRPDGITRRPCLRASGCGSCRSGTTA
jgi:hypothetical protein